MSSGEDSKDNSDPTSASADASSAGNAKTGLPHIKAWFDCRGFAYTDDMEREFDAIGLDGVEEMKLVPEEEWKRILSEGKDPPFKPIQYIAFKKEIDTMIEATGDYRRKRKSPPLEQADTEEEMEGKGGGKRMKTKKNIGFKGWQAGSRVMFKGFNIGPKILTSERNKIWKEKYQAEQAKSPNGKVRICPLLWNIILVLSILRSSYHDTCFQLYLAVQAAAATAEGKGTDAAGTPEGAHETTGRAEAASMDTDDSSGKVIKACFQCRNTYIASQHYCYNFVHHPCISQFTFYIATEED